MATVPVSIKLYGVPERVDLWFEFDAQEEKCPILIGTAALRALHSEAAPAMREMQDRALACRIQGKKSTT